MCALTVCAATSSSTSNHTSKKSTSKSTTVMLSKPETRIAERIRNREEKKLRAAVNKTLKKRSGNYVKIEFRIINNYFKLTALS